MGAVKLHDPPARHTNSPPSSKKLKKMSDRSPLMPKDMQELTQQSPQEIADGIKEFLTCHLSRENPGRLQQKKDDAQLDCGYINTISTAKAKAKAKIRETLKLVKERMGHADERKVEDVGTSES
jgi:hypothetical protein